MKGGKIMAKSQGYGGGFMNGPFIIFLVLILLVLSSFSY